MEKYMREALRRRLERKHLCQPMVLAKRAEILDGGSKLYRYTKEIFDSGKEFLLYA